jgi:hypothetical protein
LNLVDKLHNEGGNNQWLTTTDPTDFINHYQAGSGEQFNQQLDWVLQYTDNPTLGGY